MKNKIQISFLALLILIFTSCGKLIDEFYLTSEMKANIPFQGNETISFKNNSDNVIVLIGENRENFIIKETTCVNCSDFYNCEVDKINFKNEFYSISLNLFAGESYSFDIYVADNKESFSCGFSTLPLTKETLSYQEVYYDSLVFNNTTYYNIYADSLWHQGIIQMNPYPVYCYYSTAYGVIKIDFSDSTSWELESIEW